MLIITSDGLSTPDLINRFQQTLRPTDKTAAIIPTASNPFNERGPSTDIHANIMRQCGLDPTLIDIETQDTELLQNYDVIILIGGNPYYLLDILQKKNCGPLFAKLVSEDKTILGMSAGSMVMGSTIDFVNLLTPEMDVGLSDYTGLALVDAVICPHASTFVAGMKGSAEKLAKYEHEIGRKITRINDGEALFIDNQ